MDVHVAKIVKVGNSRGIILSKKALEKIGVTGEQLQLEVTEEAISIKPFPNKTRVNWDKAFKKMKKAGDDQPLLPDTFKDENLSDWKW